jgi:hypothetical protein
LSVDIGEGREIVQAFTQEQGLTFPILLDENGGVAQGYRIRGVPTAPGPNSVEECNDESKTAQIKK